MRTLLLISLISIGGYQLTTFGDTDSEIQSPVKCSHWYTYGEPGQMKYSEGKELEVEEASPVAGFYILKSGDEFAQYAVEFQGKDGSYTISNMDIIGTGTKLPKIKFSTHALLSDLIKPLEPVELAITNPERENWTSKELEFIDGTENEKLVRAIVLKCTLRKPAS